MTSSATHSKAQAGVAKAVELQAVHAALLRSDSSHAAKRLHAGLSSSLSRFSNQLSAAKQDYPVFTPTYKDEPKPYIHLRRKTLNNWGRFIPEGEVKGNELVVSDNKFLDEFSSPNNPKSVYSTEHLSNISSCLDLQTAPRAKISKSKFTNIDQKNPNRFSETMPSFDTRPSLPSKVKTKGANFSWLFHRSKKKPKSEFSSNTFESEEWGALSVETLKKELQMANEKRYSANAEVAEMRSSLKELQQKLSSLESYYGELKKSLRDEIHTSERTNQINSSSFGDKDNIMPVSHEVMVEGFLQIVSEVRLSVNHFCKNLIKQVDETGHNLMEKLTLNKKNSKEVLYHLEALISQCLYQDFENCVFQKNGSQKVLDLDRNRIKSFSDFVAIRNMSWNDVLRKGSKCYSEDFSIFCNQKMSSIVSILNWWRPWPELLLQSFFIAAKCIWLLHLLAFSFNPHVMILRVDESAAFDPVYMEDVLGDKQRRTLTKVKVMVMPGFYLRDRVFRCRVLCKYGEL